MCVAVLCLVVPIAACDSPNRPPGMTEPSPVPQQPAVTRTLSGQVFEVIPGSRVPATDFSLLVVVASVSPCPAPCISTTTFTRERTTTGADGRYHFPRLPTGSAIVLAGNSATHRQVCGAAAVLGVATQLDVEVTSRANPQPSPTMPPLRVSGQIYETTSAGRVGLDGAVIGMEWMAPDSPFLDVQTDKGGRYTACGIPASTPIAFWTGKTGYLDTYVWHDFSADSSLDIELKRR